MVFIKIKFWLTQRDYCNCLRLKKKKKEKNREIWV